MAIQYEDDIYKRLRRIEGQVRGVIKMMEEEKGCKEVVGQLSAVRTATDRVIAYITAVNLEQCVLEAKDKGDDTRKVVQEAVELLMKSIS